MGRSRLDELDSFDRKIIGLLQRNSRRTGDQLSELVGLSAPACLLAPKLKEARFEKRYGARFRAYQNAVPYAVPYLKGVKDHDEQDAQ